jgi:hypothetical protein
LEQENNKENYENLDESNYILSGPDTMLISTVLTWHHTRYVGLNNANDGGAEI